MSERNLLYALRWFILERDAFTCQYCGQHAPDVKLEVDHIVPIANGGTNDPSNLLTACYACNRGRNASTLRARGYGLTTMPSQYVKSRAEKLGDIEGEITPSSISKSMNITDAHARVVISRALRSGLIKRIRPGIYYKTT